MKGGLKEAIEAVVLVGGHVDEELLIRDEYLAAKTKILKSQKEVASIVMYKH